MGFYFNLAFLSLLSMILAIGMRLKIRLKLAAVIFTSLLLVTAFFLSCRPVVINHAKKLDSEVFAEKISHGYFVYGKIDPVNRIDDYRILSADTMKFKNHVQVHFNVKPAPGYYTNWNAKNGLPYDNGWLNNKIGYMRYEHVLNIYFVFYIRSGN